MSNKKTNVVVEAAEDTPKDREWYRKDTKVTRYYGDGVGPCGSNWDLFVKWSLSEQKGYPVLRTTSSTVMKTGLGVSVSASKGILSLSPTADFDKEAFLKLMEEMAEMMDYIVKKPLKPGKYGKVELRGRGSGVSSIESGSATPDDDAPFLKRRAAKPTAK